MKLKPVLLLFFPLMLTISCKKSEEAPQAPEIEFGGFNYLEKDANGADLTIELVIKFKDKNGDLGRIEAEKKDACGKDIKDLLIFYEKLVNGIYIPDMLPVKDTILDVNCNIIAINDSTQVSLSRALTYIQPEGLNKSIEGEIALLMRKASDFLTFPDRGRFRIILKDRAGNLSNEIYSDELFITR